jgi:hypothetical protein
MKRYAWDDYKKSLEKDQKQKTKQRHDDYPTLLKYLMNSQPTFRGLRDGARMLSLMSGGRKNGY